MGMAHEQLAVLEPQTETRRPPLFKVIMLNDDYTPMDFVTNVIKSVFHKTPEEAARLTLEVHNRGSAMVGVFTRDIADTKVDQVIARARQAEHPLQCSVEKE